MQLSKCSQEDNEDKSKNTNMLVEYIKMLDLIQNIFDIRRITNNNNIE